MKPLKNRACVKECVKDPETTLTGEVCKEGRAMPRNRPVREGKSPSSKKSKGRWKRKRVDRIGAVTIYKRGPTCHLYYRERDLGTAVSPPGDVGWNDGANYKKLSGSRRLLSGLSAAPNARRGRERAENRRFRAFGDSARRSYFCRFLPSYLYTAWARGQALLPISSERRGCAGGAGGGARPGGAAP